MKQDPGMVCKAMSCGGHYRLDGRVPTGAGQAFDHYTCLKCGRIKMVPITENPASLETEIRRGYGET